MKRRAIFLIHLVQDVAVLRPLAVMAARDFGFETVLLVSTRFLARDASGIWRSELQHLAAATGARLEYFANLFEARPHLVADGLIFSASESSLPQHALSHDLFKSAPAGLVKVTVQHGYECVGFRQNADHERSHGGTATFAADILCAWSSVDDPTAMPRSQRPKVVVTGPPAVLQLPVAVNERGAAAPGLVCENLHSVRFKGSSKSRSEFVVRFGEFAQQMKERGRQVTLRAHPGGQYSIRNKIELPSNVTMDNAPLYRVDLRQFAYGVSAPSSVLVDMLLAGIPTAVWQDQSKAMDTTNYSGLPQVSSTREWVDFAREAENDPGPLIAAQSRFLNSSGMPLDPRDVFHRFAGLFTAVLRKDIDAVGPVDFRDKYSNNVDERPDTPKSRTE
jgi:hypothetical protein